jgi:hypothetical protein
MFESVTKARANAKSAKSAKSAVQFSQFSQFSPSQRLANVFRVLESRCPAHVEQADWQQAVEDGRRFLAAWKDQAAALGWTDRDLFGLQPVPPQPSLRYRRLSRYDETGLIWLLRGASVVALTDSTAAVANTSGAITTYRRNRPTD